MTGQQKEQVIRKYSDRRTFACDRIPNYRLSLELHTAFRIGED